MAKLEEGWVGCDRAVRPPPLDEGDVHVWRIRLDAPAIAAAPCCAALDAEETARARRFHFRRDRDRFSASRLTQRALLAAYAGRSCREIRYAVERGGKPVLDAPKDAGLHFNLSRSGPVALFAVSRAGPVGVDVEVVEAGAALALVVENHFAEPEKRVLAGLSGDRRLAAFYRVWTGKEAYVKATGSGLSQDLRSVVVNAEPDAPAAYAALGGGEAEAAEWTLSAFNPGARLVGAVAIRRKPAFVRRLALEPDPGP